MCFFFLKDVRCASAGKNSDLAGTLIQFHKSFKIKTTHVNARLKPSSNPHSGSTILKNKIFEKKVI